MRCLLASIVVSLILTVPARADKLVLVAGGDKPGNNIPATEAKLTTPFGIDFDKDGNAYMVEMTGHRVLKIDTKGVLHVIGGTGKKGSGGDGGPATKAEFNNMHSLAVAPNGDIYIADTNNNKVRKIEAKTGIVTTVAGTGKKGFSGDGGPALKAEFGGIYCIAFDANGEKLYLTDLDNRRIRVLDLSIGKVATVAGNGTKGVPQDGTTATEAPLVDPRAAAIDAKGNLYILERGGHALRVVDASGRIRTVVGTGKGGLGGDDGPGTKAMLNGPKHLCLDNAGNVLIADSSNHVIRKYTPGDGKIVRVAGSGKKGIGAPGAPLDVSMNEPHGVWVDRAGTLFIVDSNNHRVLKLVP